MITEPQIGGTYEDLLRLAIWAEAQGLDAFGRSDHYLAEKGSAPVTDALTTLAGLARETQRIQLVVLVTPVTFRHPAVLAKTAATLDQMASGRLAIGVGTGWMRREHDVFGLDFYDPGERFAMLEETLEYLLAASEGGDYAGRRYALKSADVFPRPSREMQIIVGGRGLKRTPALAGRFADEYNFFVSDQDTIRARIGAMRASATSARRDPGTIKVSTMAWMVAAPDSASYRTLLEDTAAAHEMTGAEFEAQLERDNIPRGTPERLHEQAAALAAIGVDRIYIETLEPLGDIDTDWLEMVVEPIRAV